MQTLFISHSTQNDAAIDRLTLLLEGGGYRVWVDHREGIVPGMPNWDRSIRAAISAADAGLFVLSAPALNSDICASECLLVRELDKPLYVLRLEAVPPEDIWLYIKMIQYADLVHDFEAGVRDLMRALTGERAADLPQPLRAKFSGRATLRQYLPYALINPMRGRAADLAQVGARLNGSALQIIGTGGTGKSRLAAEAALTHPAGAVWHRCTEYTQASDALAQIAEHVGLPPDSRASQIMAALAGQTPLIVLDNGEDIAPKTPRRADYVALIGAVLAAGAPLLLTSRVVWDEVKPRNDLTPVTLDGAMAALLAQDFAAAERIDLSAADAAALAHAARNYPRLIEWAVGQLHERRLERLVQQLNELKSSGVQEALDEMIRKTLRQMTEQTAGGADAEALLRRLTICPGSFDMDAARALRPAALTDDDALDDALALLQKSRFVRYERQGGRYQVELMVRLAVPPDEAAFVPFADHYTAVAEQFDTRPPEEWAATVERDAENITALGDLLVEKLAAAPTRDVQERMIEFAKNITTYLRNRREVRRSIWLEMALAVAQVMGNDYWGEQALFLNALGWQATAFGDKLRALDYFDQALLLTRAISNKSGEATTLNNIGGVWYDLDEKQKALDYFAQALPLDRSTGEWGGEATTLNNIGAVWDNLGDKQKALDYYEQALPLRRAVGDKGGEATTLNNMGRVWDDLGEKQKALDYYEQALPLRRSVGDKGGEATTLNNIGLVWDVLGEKQKARDYFEQALPLMRVVSDKSGEATTCFNIAGIYAALGDLEQAISYMERCVALEEQIQHPDLDSDRQALARLRAARDGE